MMTPVWRLVLTTPNIAADTQVEDSHILPQSGDKTVENNEKVDDDAEWMNIATVRMMIMTWRKHWRYRSNDLLRKRVIMSRIAPAVRDSTRRSDSS